MTDAHRDQARAGKGKGYWFDSQDGRDLLVFVAKCASQAIAGAILSLHLTLAPNAQPWANLTVEAGSPLTSPQGLNLRYGLAHVSHHSPSSELILLLALRSGWSSETLAGVMEMSSEGFLFSPSTVWSLGIKLGLSDLVPSTSTHWAHVLGFHHQPKRLD